MGPKLLGDYEEYYFLLRETSYIYGNGIFFSRSPSFWVHYPKTTPNLDTGVTAYLNKTEWSNGDLWNLRTLYYRNTSSKSYKLLRKVVILSSESIGFS